MTIQDVQRNNNKNNNNNSTTMTTRKTLGLILLAGIQTCAAGPSSLRSRNLIVGGGTAPFGRFPYFVALKDINGETHCGGTLIAPDMVLTAAHCKDSPLVYADVGLYSETDPNGFGESIEILNPLEMISSGNWSTIRNLEKANHATLDALGFIHPEHDLALRTYDTMVMKLARPASPERPITKINTDPKVPVKQPGGKNEITIVGMGNVDAGGQWPKAGTLKQVHVDYLPYDECVDVENYNLDYKYEVLPHMICTQGAGVYGDRGQCYGDSGGPYILKGADSSQDVQVGVVSWAVNCANSLFPMVGSRTSDSAHFIKEVVCSVSSNPPDYLCLEENNSVDENLISRFIPDGVKVSVRIFSDPFGHELRWKIFDMMDENNVYAEAPYGKITGDHSFQDVIVPAGGNLKFKIDDAADDGIYGDPDAILYEIVLVDAGGELVMVEGNGQFGTSREEIFRVPQLNDEYLALVRASKVDSASQVAPVTGATAPLQIYIEFDDYHEDASWKVTSPDGSKVYAFKNANEYRYGNDVTEVVDLAPGQYKFTIKDRRGTDEFRAFNFFKLSYLDRQQRSGLGGETILYKSEGIFTGEESSTVFFIPDSAAIDISGSGSDGGSLSSPPVIIGDESFMEEVEVKLEGFEEAQTQTEPIVIEAAQSPTQGRYEPPQPENSCTDKLANGARCLQHAQCCSGNCARFLCKDETVSPFPYRERGSISGTAGGASRGRYNGV